ncbi:DUF998 domain-containing protein [Pseudactinotalea sp.]|uniref:DUF998 domain-containing protein n=1 Tax=Pseudactinotalea sp. TaxID=1926260 RepID=UPI003B3B8DBC
MIDALLMCGAVGAIGFVLVFTIDGATRPGYRPAEHPVSALSLGPRGSLQRWNFQISGALLTAGAVGIGFALDGVAGLATGVLLALFGMALIASGVWTMDPMRDYPPGAPQELDTESQAHHRHDQAGGVVFSVLPLACLTAAWALAERTPTLAIISGAAAVLLGIASYRFGVLWERASTRVGLAQRLYIVPGWLWIATLCGVLLVDTGI